MRGSIGYTDGLLRNLLGPAVEEASVERPSFSLFLSEDPSQLHRLIWGSCAVVRTGDPDRAVRALLRHLGAGLAPGPGVVRLRAPVVGNSAGRAVIVADSARRELARLSRDLTRAGLIPGDMAVADIDVSTREVLVPDGFDVGPLPPLAAHRRRIEAQLASGRYEVAGVVTFGAEDQTITGPLALMPIAVMVEPGIHPPLADLVTLATSMPVHIRAAGGGRPVAEVLKAALR